MKASDVRISSPGKVLFPRDAITKDAMAGYYRRICPWMVPLIQGRPLTMKRYSEGIDKPGFYNKHAPGHFPAYVERLEVPVRSRNGGLMKMIAVDEAADLVYLAGQNVVELHMGLSKAPHIDNPDQLILDFDPSDEDFGKIRTAAFALKAMLDERGLPSFLKTSGSRGMHVHVPLRPVHPFDDVKLAARRLAEALNERCPALTTVEIRKNKRGDRVFIDYLRNDYSATAIAPYSLRAIDQAPVATPVDWEELAAAGFHPRKYTLRNIFRRLGHKQDPWRDFDKQACGLEQLRF